MPSCDPALTVEGQLSPGHVSASGIFGHALIDTSVLLLEVGDFEDPVGLVSPGLPRYWLSVRPSPDDGRHWADMRRMGVKRVRENRAAGDPLRLALGVSARPSERPPDVSHSRIAATILPTATSPPLLCT